MQFKNWLEQNILEAVSDYLPKLFDYLRNQPDDVLVHFSNVDKVGINPNPTHTDPVGIFTFPKSYVLNKTFNRNSHFFGMPYTFILKLKDNAKVLNLSKLTHTEADNLIDKMGIGEYRQHATHQRPGIVAKAGHFLWQTMDKAVNAQYEKYAPSGRYHNWQKNITWNKLFKKAGGFDALIDDGDSIIHSNEPSQVVILNPMAFTQLEKFQVSPVNIYKNLATRMLNKLGEAIFQDHRTSMARDSSYRNRVRMTARGEINGMSGTLSLNYEEPSEPHEKNILRHSLRGQIFLSLQHGHDYHTENFEIPLDDEETLDSNLERMISNIHTYLANPNNFRQDRGRYTQMLIQQICTLLGFGKAPKVQGETADYVKVYPQGTFMINLGYHAASRYREDAAFWCNFILKEPRNTSTSAANYMGNFFGLYGKGEISEKEVMANLPQAAMKLIQQNLQVWRQAVEQHYNPDEEKHNQYDKDNYRAWKLASVGKELLKFTNFLQSKLGR